MMKTPSDPTVSFLDRISQTVTSVGKIILQSRPVSSYPQAQEGAVLSILGNGPSLRQTLETSLDTLRKTDILSLNFAASTPEFLILRPKFYVIADPVFFSRTPVDNVRSLWENIRKATWEMNLFIPRNVTLPDKLPANISIHRFNMVGVEGNGVLESLAYRTRLGMPRPRNVLIPSIMIGIWCGYRTIHIYGADHTWTETLSVDSENRVVSIQPHFYKDSEGEHKRVAQVYADVRLHHILHSFYIAFRAYHRIKRYADSVGVSIINRTPGSFIDAFPKE